jgi:branched-subunit amino acid transport protein
MTLWLIILGMMIVTYGTRLSVIALLRQDRLPDSISRALRFVPPAALSAIIFPAVLMPNDTLDISLGNERLLAGVIAAVVAWYSKNRLLSIAAGMVLLWVLQGLT